MVYAFSPVDVWHINLANVISYLGLAFIRETTLAICNPIHGVAAVQVALGFDFVLRTNAREKNIYFYIEGGPFNFF